jgi:hypothetical protein
MRTSRPIIPPQPIARNRYKRILHHDLRQSLPERAPTFLGPSCVVCAGAPNCPKIAARRAGAAELLATPVAVFSGSGPRFANPEPQAHTPHFALPTPHFEAFSPRKYPYHLNSVLSGASHLQEPPRFPDPFARKTLWEAKRSISLRPHTRRRLQPTTDY